MIRGVAVNLFIKEKSSLG